MIPGRLSSIRSIDWTPEKPGGPDWKRLLSWEGVKELCSEMTTSLETWEDDRWLPAMDSFPTYHCPDCQIFLFRGRIR